MDYFRKFSSEENLKIAWQRIRTGKNVQYKKYFRKIYDSFEISSAEHIRRLSYKIRDDTYTPEDTVRIYIPKPSGLQRPITLISVYDQIILQGIANVFAIKLLKKRRKVERDYVCSNILNDDINDKFFLKPWKNNYKLFRNQIKQAYKQGYRYISDFDISAFYDTIQHNLFCKVFSPRGVYGEFCDWIKSYLRNLTCNRQNDIGIPQGPIASNFLAECILLPIDIKMKNYKYLRYVDDIRLFGENSIDLQCAIVELESLCRERGFIPHPKKFEIRRLNSLKDAFKNTASFDYLNIEGFE